MAHKEICSEAQTYASSLESFSSDVTRPTVLICDGAREARRIKEFLRHLRSELKWKLEKELDPFSLSLNNGGISLGYSEEMECSEDIRTETFTGFL